MVNAAGRGCRIVLQTDAAAITGRSIEGRWATRL